MPLLCRHGLNIAVLDRLTQRLRAVTPSGVHVTSPNSVAASKLVPREGDEMNIKQLQWLQLTTIALVTTIALATIGGMVVYGQASSTEVRSATLAGRSATMVLSLAVPKENISEGQTPWVFLTVKNLSQDGMPFPQDRVHVEGEKGEPPTTLFQRQLTHKLLPGEQEVRDTGYGPFIEPGASFTRKYDLTKLYDLSSPGKYSVYVDVLDHSASKNNAGVWVRSNTAKFEITPSAQ
jgi:hypothetical protein